MLQKRCKKKTLMTRSLGGFELNVIAIAKNGGTMQRNATGGATTMRKNQYVTIKPSLVFLKSKVNRLAFLVPPSGVALLYAPICFVQCSELLC